VVLKKLLYIARYKALAVLLLLLLALASARAQNVTPMGETTDLSVKEMPGDIYTWELYSDSTLNFALTAGVTTGTFAEFVGSNVGAKVSVLWKEIGTYFFKVTAMNAAGCTNNIRIGIMKVLPPLPTAVISPPEPICDGQTASLEVTLTGKGPWELNYTDGTNNWTVTAIMDKTCILRVTPNVTTQYWVYKLSDLWGINNNPSNKVLLEVNPRPVSSKIYEYESE